MAGTMLVGRQAAVRANAEVGPRMDKREFLKSSGAVVAGGVMSRLGLGQQKPGPRENWAGNITYSTDRVHEPANLDELRKTVKELNKVRVLGSRHSFNRI